MLMSIRSGDFVRRSLAFVVVLCAGVAVMGAQAISPHGSEPAMQNTASAAQAQQPMSVQTPAVAASGDALFSSSSAENQALDTGTDTQQGSLKPLPVNFADAMQYGGGRRRYGSPRYRGGNTNADGSSKYIFYAGAGFGQTVGNTYKYLTPSWGFQVGGGRQFNKHIAVPIEFDYDHFGLTRANISAQSYIYSGDPNAADNSIDANSHIWSFSVDPTYTLINGDSGGLGAYVVVGAGFYHKVANFTAPQTGVQCYYYCGQVTYQGNFDHYTSNAPGFSGGFGLTYKFSHFSNERFYGEVRYVFMDNSQRQGFTLANLNTTTYSGYDLYPANSNRTTYIPFKFGVRF